MKLTALHVIRQLLKRLPTQTIHLHPEQWGKEKAGNGA
jgi:hypothetical protein